MKIMESCEKSTKEEDGVPVPPKSLDKKDAAPEKKKHDDGASNHHVDLDLLLKTVNVSLVGEEGNQENHNTAVDPSPPEKNGGLLPGDQPDDTETMGHKGLSAGVGESDTIIGSSCEPACSSSVLPNANPKDGLESQGVTGGGGNNTTVQQPNTPAVKDEEPKNTCALEKGAVTSESDDEEEEEEEEEGEDLSLVPCVMEEDESHFITTHEIQLSELSDHETGSTSWEIEEGDNNQMYSFVDYASFDGGDDGGGGGGGGRGRGTGRASNSNSSSGGAAVSTSLLEGDLRHLRNMRAKCAGCGSDEKCNATGQQIHLSIKTTSRAINNNDPSNNNNIMQERGNILYRPGGGDGVSRYVYQGPDAGRATERFCDSSKCFIAMPGRVHLIGTKLKAKDVINNNAGGHSTSGTSSAVSELDDADKEVRSLTAKAFKSLAYPSCPHFDAINFSASSESSASELGGINRWSATATYVDLKYGNLSQQGLDQSVISRHHQNATSSFEIAKKNTTDNKGYKGSIALKPPPSKIFTLNGNNNNNPHNNPHNNNSASSSTKKIELMGKFGQGHSSGVITLTETLNIRCNVKSGMSAAGGERRSKLAQNAAAGAGGSRSTTTTAADEVTNTALPSSGPQRRGATGSKPPGCNSAAETMEDAHKKAIFASSLLKNVLSKKMQFEQERKMERGEICEPYRPRQTPSPCLLLPQDAEAPQRDKGAAAASSREPCREFYRRSSSAASDSSESSDYTIVCVDDLGDMVDNSSSDTRSEGRRRRDTLITLETNLESTTNEAGIDAKRGAFEAAKSTLLRSQNSAFRSWRDGELGFQKEHNKNDQTPPEGKPPSLSPEGETDPRSDPENSALLLTKMSHFFVPSIQLLSSDTEVGNMNYSTRADHGEGGGGGGVEVRSDKNTLYVADSRRVVTSKSPEIKINLRSVRGNNKSDPFGISKLRAPNIGSGGATGLGRTDDSRCQALAAALRGEFSDKIPHFMVRDIRDTKGKQLQTPIHQVRDVRKLVKSSYHFVSLDNNNDNKNNVAAGEQHNAEQKKQGLYRNPASVSPIVIKCQSVNTNSNGKQSGNLTDVGKRGLSDDPFEVDGSSPEGAKSGTVQLQKAPGRGALANTKRAHSSEGATGLKIETTAASSKQEKTPDSTDKKPESKMANQAALAKLQAAVKTMEQLYVFDRNEWKRKSAPRPRPLADSHMLTGAEDEPSAGVDRPGRRDSYPKANKTPPAPTASPGTDVVLRRGEERETPRPCADVVLRRGEERETPRPCADVVLRRGEERETPRPCADVVLRRGEERETPRSYHSPTGREERPGAKSFSVPGVGGAAGNKNNLSSSGQKVAAINNNNNNTAKAPLPNAVTQQTPYGTKGFVPKSPKLPVSLKICQTTEDKERREAERPHHRSYHNDSEDYLTIPVRSQSTKQAASGTAAGGERASVYTVSAAAGGGQMRAVSPPGHVGFWRPEERSQSPRRASIVMETRSQQDTPTATIYHHPLPMGVSPVQPQVYCFSPGLPPAPALDPFLPTQRKMLLDPTTGNYYLVDTPVQPATRRLFDPETGQYVDVPMPQPPMTPMPMPMSPLAFGTGGFGPAGGYGPGGYGQTYMIYPGLMPAPTMIPALTLVPSQMSMQSEVDVGEKAFSQQAEGMYMESPYYMATGKSPRPMGHQHVTAARAPQVFSGSSPQVFSGSSPQVFSGSSPQVFSGSVPQVFSGSSPQVFSGSSPQVFSGSSPQVFSGSSPQVFSGSSPQVFSGSSPQVFSGSVPQVFSGSSPQVFSGSSPQVFSGSSPQVFSGSSPQVFSGAMQPVISITSQQGPRIIAPPSFDGTTMSFVLEHR